MTTPTAPEQVKRHNYVLRVIMWLLAPFVDSWDGLSLNRFLAILFGTGAVRSVHWKGGEISWPDVAMAVVAGALSFGKDVFLAYLDRKQGDHG
jgi:hypothetical protein